MAQLPMKFEKHELCFITTSLEMMYMRLDSYLDAKSKEEEPNKEDKKVLEILRSVTDSNIKDRDGNIIPDLILAISVHRELRKFLKRISDHVLDEIAIENPLEATFIKLQGDFDDDSNGS